MLMIAVAAGKEINDRVVTVKNHRHGDDDSGLVVVQRNKRAILVPLGLAILAATGTAVIGSSIAQNHAIRAYSYNSKINQVLFSLFFKSFD